MIKDCGDKFIKYYILDSNKYLRKRLTERAYSELFYKVKGINLRCVVEHDISSGRELIESLKMTRFKWYKI